MEGFVWGLELLSLACFLTDLHLELALDELSVNPNKLHLRPLTKCSFSHSGYRFGIWLSNNGILRLFVQKMRMSS